MRHVLRRITADTVLTRSESIPLRSSRTIDPNLTTGHKEVAIIYTRRYRGRNSINERMAQKPSLTNAYMASAVEATPVRGKEKSYKLQTPLVRARVVFLWYFALEWILLILRPNLGRKE